MFFGKESSHQELKPMVIEPYNSLRMFSRDSTTRLGVQTSWAELELGSKSLGRARARARARLALMTKARARLDYLNNFFLNIQIEFKNMWKNYFDNVIHLTHI